MKTELEIARQIKGLENNKKSLPAYSTFGTPNHRIIDTQIEILKRELILSDVNEGDWEEMDTENEIYRAAEEADSWLFGNRDEDLFDPEDEETENIAYFSVVKVEAAIGIKSNDWKGNCYAISDACLKAGLVPNGVLRYGHYRGPIDPKSMFYKNSAIGFCQHGWIELPNNQIWDPTRWVFENKEPYIYIGKNDHYDVGGNIHRMKIRTPAPKFDENQKIVQLNAEKVVIDIVRSILGDSRVGNKFTLQQIVWSANENPITFGNNAKDFYQALKDIKMEAFIPIDNWKLIMEK